MSLRRTFTLTVTVVTADDRKLDGLRREIQDEVRDTCEFNDDVECVLNVSLGDVESVQYRPPDLAISRTELGIYHQTMARRGYTTHQARHDLLRALGIYVDKASQMKNRQWDTWKAYVDRH